MKLKFVEDIQNVIQQGKTWISLEMEYAKLSLAEKLTILLTTLIIGFICLLLGMVVLILLGFALVEVFKLFMAPGFAYLTVAGIICVFLALLWIFRQPLLENPLAKLLTKILIDKKK